MTPALPKNISVLECPVCKKPVQVTIEPGHILNLEIVSTVTVMHAGETLCPCGAVVVPVLLGVQASFCLTPIPPEKQKRLVQPVQGRIA